MRGLITLFIIASALVVTPVYSQDGTQLKGPKGVDYSAQERSIGPIKPTDTLWRIAAKVRPDNSVNIYQVMVALYEKSPSSFLDKNLNHMRDGAYLKVPTIAQMRAISSALAKQRSEQDDELWEKKKNGTLTKNDIDTSQKKLTQARRADVDQAKQELQQEINTIKTEQDMRLVELQNQFKSSVKNVEELLIENNKLKQQLISISTELENVRNQLGQDSEIQIQLKGLISKQNEIIEQQKVKKQHNSEFSIVGLLSSPLILILMMAIAALLIIAGIVFFLKNRNNQELKANDEGDFLLQAPTYNADENNDLDPGLEPISSNSTDGENDDLSVRLDDGLDSDILPEDDDMMFDDPLEGLLNDDVFFDDEKSDDDDLDISLQQDFDQTAGDSLRDDIDLDSDPEEKNTDNILSEELASEEDDEDLDIDSLIDEALAGSADELSEAQEELDVDDVESLASSLTDEPELDDTPLGAESELENAYDEDSLLNDEDYVEPKEWSEADNELEYAEIDLGDDPLADDTDLAKENGLESVSSRQELELDDELVDPENDDTQSDNIQNDNASLDGESEYQQVQQAPLQTSQAEQHLDHALGGGNSDAEALSDSDKLDRLEENTAADTEASMDEELAAKAQNKLSVQKIDDDFMADLSQTDFDALLNELADSEDFNGEDTSDFDVDFKALLNEDLENEVPADENLAESLSKPGKESQGELDEIDNALDDKFVDIDSLIEQSDEQSPEYEPYDDVNMDVGLGDFDALLAGDNPTDVDIESGGYSAKLDLARAYIEIDDMYSAMGVIEEVITNGPEEVQQEALSLKAKLKP